MSETKSVQGTGGVGVFGLLGVLFIGLKLGGVIAWPWLWVLAPFWGGLVLTLLIVFIGVLILAAVDK